MSDRGPLSRRVASALLIVQIVYLGLLGLAFSFVGADTAGIDHTHPDTAGRHLQLAGILATMLVMTGGVLLLGREKARARVPRTGRLALLGVLCLGELAVAGGFLHAITRESFGPDTVIGLLGIAAATLIALVCAGEFRTGRPSAAAAGQG
ncbi:hypothetical protein GCM10010387_66680 [Streptomyces inusitatus]|uniref:Uncharacterized protein n=1 Tax=Streptomyces inusitatus TaxID=68221 RepID=A0A918V3M7_9ACTN|nr:hypothetical protein [Streptomyces inusitatus]GGZ64068.1 hypothetical protein GCM10010387_66680 [Streptomyces inusitatus]